MSKTTKLTKAELEVSLAATSIALSAAAEVIESLINDRDYATDEIDKMALELANEIKIGVKEINDAFKQSSSQ